MAHELVAGKTRLLERVSVAIRARHDALARRFPGAPIAWRWQFVLPAGRTCREERWGGPSRYHIHESVIQRAVTAVRSPLDRL